MNGDTLLSKDLLDSLADLEAPKLPKYATKACTQLDAFGTSQRWPLRSRYCHELQLWTTEIAQGWKLVI